MIAPDNIQVSGVNLGKKQFTIADSDKSAGICVYFESDTWEKAGACDMFRFYFYIEEQAKVTGIAVSYSFSLRQEGTDAP